MNSEETLLEKQTFPKVKLCNIIGFKPYITHCTQQLYDEDMDLRVEMAKHLIPILEDQAK